MDGHRSYSIYYLYSWRQRVSAITADIYRPYPLSYNYQSCVGSSCLMLLYWSNRALGLLPRSTISMGKARILGLSIAKCKGERTLQEISWLSGGFFFDEILDPSDWIEDYSDWWTLLGVHIGAKPVALWKLFVVWRPIRVGVLSSERPDIG